VLLILGDGPERDRLEQLGSELGLGGSLLLPGRAGDVTAWLKRAELLVHPARWEGFGLVLLEAMLAGLPVVACRVSAIPEVVADGESGLLVPPDDPEALAAALERVLADTSLARRLGEGGRERARTEFSVERMASATADVYRRAL
jgi:glycosyltransferase involved in cell wall biosynthesis